MAQKTEVYCEKCGAVLMRATCRDDSELNVETDFDLSCDGNGKHTAIVSGRPTTMRIR